MRRNIEKYIIVLGTELRKPREGQNQQPLCQSQEGRSWPTDEAIGGHKTTRKGCE